MEKGSENKECENNKQKREQVPVYISQEQLEDIDSHISKHSPRYNNRSHFFSIAANEQIKRDEKCPT